MWFVAFPSTIKTGMPFVCLFVAFLTTVLADINPAVNVDVDIQGAESQTINCASYRPIEKQVSLASCVL